MTTPRQYVLGIDLGTQSVKTVVYDAARRRLAAISTAPLDLDSPEPGIAEQQARWWIDALAQSLGGIDYDLRRSISAVGVSGQQHGFVALDEKGNVLSPVKLWCDTSTDKECQEIMSAVGGKDACIDIAGNPVLPGYTASKLRWFGKSDPEAYGRLDTILLPHDYLNFYLTGERCMEAGDASGTGFFDVRRRRWSAELLQAIDPDNDLASRLPGVRLANEAIGYIRKEAADQFGLPCGVPVSIGGGDNMMGAIGTGNVRPGVITMSLGTSGTVYAYSDKPVIDRNGCIAAFCSSTGGWLPLLCTMNCTVATELTRRLFGADIETFENQVSQSPRGANGVLTIPYFNGERTPDLPHASACFSGLNSQNMQPENLLRAALEGATYALRFGIDELQRLGMQADEIVLTGGGANSPTWRQVVADVCNLPVNILDQTEGAAFGAALQATQLVNPGSTIEDVVDDHLSRNSQLCCEPDERGVSLYRESYESYQRTADAIASVYGTS